MWGFVWPYEECLWPRNPMGHNEDIVFTWSIASLERLAHANIFSKQNANIVLQDGNGEIEDIPWHGKGCRCCNNCFLKGSPLASLTPYHPRSYGATWVKGCFLMLTANTFWGLWLVLQTWVTEKTGLVFLSMWYTIDPPHYHLMFCNFLGGDVKPSSNRPTKERSIFVLESVTKSKG
uniref:Uncharacterized protein n=1 Tax=Vitis vinifera TaxID=29760 RepID=A5BTB9_VITVI|nr:hypothetical protein VITISV_026187 [Vitis vinifera]